MSFGCLCTKFDSNYHLMKAVVGTLCLLLGIYGCKIF